MLRLGVLMDSLQDWRWYAGLRLRDGLHMEPCIGKRYGAMHTAILDACFLSMQMHAALQALHNKLPGSMVEQRVFVMSVIHT